MTHLVITANPILHKRSSNEVTHHTTTHHAVDMNKTKSAVAPTADRLIQPPKKTTQTIDSVHLQQYRARERQSKLQHSKETKSSQIPSKNLFVTQSNPLQPTYKRRISEHHELPTHRSRNPLYPSHHPFPLLHPHLRLRCQRSSTRLHIQIHPQIQRRDQWTRLRRR